MAEWKKVVVSGSSAELDGLTLDTQLAVGSGGTGLTTTNLSGQAGKSLAVNVGETGFTFADASAPAGTISASATGDAQGQIKLNGQNVDINAMQTDDSPQFAGVNIGNASDTTLTRASAGVLAVEGNSVLMASGGGIVSGSGQVLLQSADKTGFTGAASITTLGTVTSGDVSAILPAGTVSGSAQIAAGLPSGVVSGSGQVVLQSADKTVFTGAASITTLGTVTSGDVSAILPSGTVSGSAQVVAGLPTGVVSGSASQARTQISAQESNQKLTDIAGLAVTDGNIIVGDGSNFVAESGGTARTSLGLGSSDSVTFNNLTISNDLTVQGTASFENTENLKVADRFIALASGSGQAGDGGIVIEQSNVGGGKGQVFGFDNANGGRWGLVSGFNPTASAFTPSDLMVTATTSTSAPATAPTYGGSAGGAGNIHVDTSTNGGEIYIYV